MEISLSLLLLLLLLLLHVCPPLPLACSLCWGGGGGGGAYKVLCEMAVEGDEGRWWHGVDEVVVELCICQCEVGGWAGG